MMKRILGKGAGMATSMKPMPHKTSHRPPVERFKSRSTQSSTVVQDALVWVVN